MKLNEFNAIIVRTSKLDVGSLLYRGRRGFSAGSNVTGLIAADGGTALTVLGTVHSIGYPHSLIPCMCIQILNQTYAEICYKRKKSLMCLILFPYVTVTNKH